MSFSVRDPDHFYKCEGGFGEIPKPTVKVWMGKGMSGTAIIFVSYFGIQKMIVFLSNKFQL